MFPFPNTKHSRSWKFTSSLEKIANFNCHPKKYEFLDNRLAGIYEEILSKLDIKIIHINHLINLLVEINDLGKVELSNITKDLSNKIVYIYALLPLHIPSFL